MSQRTVQTIQQHLQPLSHSHFSGGLVIYGVHLHSSLKWPTFKYCPLCGFLLCNAIPFRLDQPQSVCCLAYMSLHGKWDMGYIYVCVCV